MISLKSTLSLLAAVATVGGTCAFDLDATRVAAPATLAVSPRFEPSPCPFTPAADQVEGRTLECGVVLVPEDRRHPTGTWIRLAVAVFRSPVVAARPPVFLGGGPGTSILERFGPGVSGSFARDLTDGRDFVVFDQRGVGFSRPSLSCEELIDLKYRTIGSHQTREQEIEDTVHAAFACRDRLLASGIELAAYTAAANAADVNDIRVALGYDQVDVWGLSYGTRLGLAVVQDFPEIVHSLVLESAGEYDPRTPPAYAQIAGRALRNSWWLAFPGIGHFIARLSPCAHSMMIDFLADPALTPDASCIADMGPPMCFIPASTRSPL